jgi:hypothetical protein
MYNRVHLAQRLNISDKELSVWFKHLGIKKRDGKVIYITPEQEEFMRNNYKSMTHEKMGEAIGLTSVSVARYCCNNGLIKMKVQRVGTIPRIIPDPPKPKIQRPPAVYNNTSREQHIDRWLNVAI